MCVWVCTCEHSYLKSWFSGSRSYRCDSCKPPAVGSGNRTQILQKSSEMLLLLSHLSNPHHFNPLNVFHDIILCTALPLCLNYNPKLSVFSNVPLKLSMLRDVPAFEELQVINVSPCFLAMPLLVWPSPRIESTVFSYAYWWEDTRWPSMKARGGFGRRGSVDLWS